MNQTPGRDRESFQKFSAGRRFDRDSHHAAAAYGQTDKNTKNDWQIAGGRGKNGNGKRFGSEHGSDQGDENKNESAESLLTVNPKAMYTGRHGLKHLIREQVGTLVKEGRCFGCYERLPSSGGAGPSSGGAGHPIGKCPVQAELQGRKKPWPATLRIAQM
jgi:hypothetical protein